MAEPVKPACVDLRAVFGDRFRIRKEADGETWGATPEAERVWLLELPCKYGVVYPQGGDILAATITSRRIGNMVAALPCIRTSRGDIERVVTFRVDDAEPVLALLRPYRAHVMTEARRLALAAAQARSPLCLTRDGDGSRGREAETGVRIDAAAETDLGRTLDLPDAGNRAGAGQPRSRRAAQGWSS